MSPERNIRNVALIGFMGAGKSTVGHLAAQMLRFDFLDTDELIEKQAGRSITEIFENEGEPRFRQYESETLRSLEEASGKVISTGGGAVVNPENMTSLKAHALVVCLWASPEVIYERVRHQTHRPLLHDPDPLEKIRRLLQEREGAYRQADILLNSSLRPPRELAQHVAHHFRELRAGNAD